MILYGDLPLEPLNTNLGDVASLQTTAPPVTVAFGEGFTVMVNVFGNPGQLSAVGFTVIVETIGVEPKFVAVNDGISLLSASVDKPIATFEFVQSNTVFGVRLSKTTGLLNSPLQSSWSSGLATTGVGFTVIVKLTSAPGQPLALDLTVMFATIDVSALLIALKEGILSPEPELPRFGKVISLFQIKSVAAGTPIKLISGVSVLLQTDISLIGSIFGVGFTVILTFKVSPGQSSTYDIAVTIASIGSEPVLMAVKLPTLPVPLDGLNPIDPLSILHLIVAVGTFVLTNVMPPDTSPLHTNTSDLGAISAFG